MASLQASDIPEKYFLPILPEIQGVDPTRSVVEAFKIAAAKLVADAWEEDVAKIYPAVEMGKKGADLSVAVVRFKRGKPADLEVWTKKVIDNVGGGRHEYEESADMGRVVQGGCLFLWREDS